MGNENISVIVPVYNEEREIGKVLSRLGKAFSNAAVPYEIIVVNDASTDNTRNVIFEATSNIKLLDNPVNIGYGASIKKGLKIAKYEIVAIIDADNTYPVEEIPNFLNLIGNYDMVVGDRIKIVYPKLNWIKQRGRNAMDWLCSYLTSSWIPDINSGLRIFKKNIVLKFIDQLSNRFSFTTSLTLLMFFHQYKIKYLPIQYRTNPTESVSKVRIWRDGLKTLLLIFNLGFRYRPVKMFLLFVILIILFFLVGVSLNY